MQTDDPKTWLAGISALLAGLAAWFTRRQVKAWDDKQADHERRIGKLETIAASLADKGDITAVFTRINQVGDQTNLRIQQIGDQISEQHTTLLNTLLGKQL